MRTLQLPIRKDAARPEICCFALTTDVRKSKPAFLDHHKQHTCIASDRVDDVFVERPHRTDIKFIRRFMLIFGPFSSLFDFATFGVLLWLMKANEQSFQTGWFIESILSAGVVVFAVRTRLPFTRSHPSRAMLTVTVAIMLITLWLPYSPLAGLLDFVPLSLPYLLVIFGIVALYFMSAELTKRWFYHQIKNNG